MACVTAGPVAGPSSILLLSQGSWGSPLVPRPGCLADVKVGKQYMLKEEPDGLLPGWWSPSLVCRDPLTSSSRLGEGHDLSSKEAARLCSQWIWWKSSCFL